MTADIGDPSQPQPAPQPPAAPITPTPAEKTNPFQRIIGVFIAPTETFESIARRPDVAMPLIIHLVLALVIGLVMVRYFDFAAPAREAMEAQGNASQAQIDQAVRFSSAIGKTLTYASPLLALLYFLIVASVLYLVFRMFGGDATWQQAFSVTLYAGFVRALLSIIMAVILVARGGTTNPAEVDIIVRSNPAFLVDHVSQPVLYSLLANFDLFIIWYVVVLIIGFAIISKVSRAKAASIIIGLWAIKMLIAAGFGALGQMARSRAS